VDVASERRNRIEPKRLRKGGGQAGTSATKRPALPFCRSEKLGPERATVGEPSRRFFSRAHPLFRRKPETGEFV
jgi:hypothetical protein